MRGAYIFFGLLAACCNVSAIPSVQVSVDTETEVDVILSGTGYETASFNGISFTATMAVGESFGELPPPGGPFVSLDGMLSTGPASIGIGGYFFNGLPVGQGIGGTSSAWGDLMISLVQWDKHGSPDPTQWDWGFRFHGFLTGIPIPNEPRDPATFSPATVPEAGQTLVLGALALSSLMAFGSFIKR